MSNPADHTVRHDGRRLVDPDLVELTLRMQQHPQHRCATDDFDETFGLTVPAQPPVPETVAPSVVPTQPPAPPSTAAPSPQPGWWERNAGNVADGVGWTVTIVSCILDCIESLGTGAIADRAIGIAAREGTKELILDLVGSK